ncbi:hypothetical protein BCR34DRAFT_624930 [Clohesyomyces aquaticus]|uniref:FMN-dependent dehydrogenase domain-containing protein n=1 Tax=Clohesyomyces aquaticus TaxID=1231657 RepID=A0A1Y1ZLM6_9PLEO|nr:hypothetical protein BCR34DRAFT_624930 [Clohesyomyces aquaticus]
MDPNNPNRKSRSTPKYGLYQREIFWKATTAKSHPSSPQKLAQNGWHYTSSNAGQSHTHTHNVSAPIGFAPIGINKIYHPLGELPVATVAGDLNLPYYLSTARSQPIEDVAIANDSKAEGGNGLRFFQLYMPHDDELTGRGIDAKTQPNEAGALWIDNVWHGCAHTWEKVQWVMGIWKEIRGSVRGGSDVFEALALGAKFFIVGRLWIWGLSIMGETGVHHVMRSLLVDFDILLNAR